MMMIMSTLWILLAALLEIHLVLLAMLIAPIDSTSQRSSVWLPTDIPATKKRDSSDNIIEQRRGDFVATSAGFQDQPKYQDAELAVDSAPAGSMEAASSLQPSWEASNLNSTNIRRSDQFNNNFNLSQEANTNYQPNNHSINGHVEFDEEHLTNSANFQHHNENFRATRKPESSDSRAYNSIDIGDQKYPRKSTHNMSTNSSPQNIEPTLQINFNAMHDSNPILVQAQSQSQSQEPDNEMEHLQHPPETSSYHVNLAQQARSPESNLIGNSIENQRTSKNQPKLAILNNSWSAIESNNMSHDNFDQRVAVENSNPTTTQQPPLIYYDTEGDKWNQVTTTNGPELSSPPTGSPTIANFYNRPSYVNQENRDHGLFSPQKQSFDSMPIGASEESEYERRRKQQQQLVALTGRRLRTRQSWPNYNGYRPYQKPAYYISPSSLSNHNYQLANLNTVSAASIPQALPLTHGSTSMSTPILHTSKRYDSLVDPNLYDMKMRQLGLHQKLIDQKLLNAQQHNSNNNRDLKHPSSRRWLFGALGQKLNPWQASDTNNLKAHDTGSASLENYFYQDQLPAKYSRLKDPRDTLIQQPQVAAIYPIAIADQTGLVQIKQPSVSRAPQGLPYVGQHYASQSLRQPALAHPSMSETYRQSAMPSSYRGSTKLRKSHTNKNTAAASFIPVVAVSVTRTSPAPKTEDQPVSSGDDEPLSSPLASDIDEYLDRKLGGAQRVESEPAGQHRSYSGFYRQQLNLNDYGNSASGSSRQQSINGQGSRSANSIASQDHSTTTVKSAVFGYLPHQLTDERTNPLYKALNVIQPLSSAAEYAHSSEMGSIMPPQQPVSSQYNRMIQNDILHPFQRDPNSVNSIDWSDSAAYPNHMIPRYRNGGLQYQLVNPLLTATDQSLLRMNHQGQLLAVAGSELNPLLQTVMIAPTFPLDNQAHEGQHSNPTESTSESQSISTSATSPSRKGKKRSSDFFANAGQLLLSALPLLLAPTLGLMFASSSNIPNVARHQNPLGPSSSSPSIQPALPSNYMSSLSNGFATTPQYFTTQPTIAYGGQSNKSTYAKTTKAPSLKQVLGASSRKPAAIVITSTTTSPHYSTFNSSNSSDLNRASSQSQTFTAVDTLSVHSNQTLVVIPPDLPHNHNSSPLDVASGNWTNPEEVESQPEGHSTGYSNANQNNQHASELIQQASANYTLTPKKHSHQQNHPSVEPSSSLDHFEGADFDTQYANLKPEAQAHLIKGSHQVDREPQSSNKTSQIADNNRIKYQDQTDDDDVSTKLYPVSTWPPFRRKTISLVTSQGNRSFADVSDRYQANGFSLSSSDLGVHNTNETPQLRQSSDHQEHKRTNNRLFLGLLRRNKRDTIGSLGDENQPQPSEILNGDEARQKSRSASHLITTTLVTQINHDGDEGGEQGFLSDSMLDANGLRSELLSKKIALDAVASKHPGTSAYHNLVQQTGHLKLDDQDSQFLSNGGRGKLVIPVGKSQLHRDTIYQPSSLLDSPLNGSSRLYADQGNLVAKTQHARVTSAMREPLNESSTDRSILIEDLDPKSIKTEHINPGPSRRRSAEFSRQMKHSSYIGPSNYRIDESGYQDSWPKRDWNDTYTMREYSTQLYQTERPDAYQTQHQRYAQRLKPIQASQHQLTQNSTRDYSQNLNMGSDIPTIAKKRQFPSSRAPTSTRDFRSPHSQPLPMSQLGNQSELAEAADRDFPGYSTYQNRPDPYPINRPNNNYYPSRNYQPNIQPYTYEQQPYGVNNSSFNNYNRNDYTYPNAHNYRIASGSSSPEDYAPAYDRPYPNYNNSDYGFRHNAPRNNYPPHQANQYQPYPMAPPEPGPQHYGPQIGRHIPDRPAGSWNMDQFGHSPSASNMEQPPSLIMHQAGPLASLASNNSHDSGTVNEYLKQVHFSDSDRDKLMAR